ncbi:hypothetical protein VTO73DRAFT_8563 [Trametes versicolor]
MSRAHDGSTANSSYQWDIQVAEPMWLERVPIYHDEFPDEPRGLPDVPLNINHRYYTPDPMDPRYKVEYVDPKEVFPPYNEQERTPPPGVENSPTDRRSKRQKANNGHAQSLTNKRSQSSAKNGSSAAGMSSSPTKGRGARGRPSAAAKNSTGQAKSKKNASNKSTPKTSSPRKQAASKAATNAPAAPVTQGRWYIPPRKHSTGSVSVSSDSSGSSSDSECDE